MSFRWIGLGLLSLLSQVLVAQTVNLSGVVNDYFPVNTIDRCVNAVVLDSVSGLAVGDHVVIHQAQGATVNRSQTAAHGQVQQRNGAGRFDWNEIRAIRQDTVFLRYVLFGGFTVSGNVQLVRVAYHQNINLQDTIFPRPWDGRTGGIVAIEADGALNFIAPIIASGLGFRGGDTINEPNCNPLLNLAYSSDVNGDIGGFKGEGIAAIDPNHVLGRGPNANGGGGGNDHNAGGAGGGNAGAGGEGGQRLNAPFGCGGPFPGLGGYSLTHTGQRAFFGGGGGAGDQNNGVGTPGGNGGGIVLIKAPNIQANGRVVDVTGESVTALSGGDGSGGAGAGGTVIIDASFINGSILVNAQGGDGGSTNNSNDPSFCMGPGGGGGGGFVSFSFPQPNPNTNIFTNIQGGLAGVTVNANANAACAGSANGAQPGQNGIVQWNGDTIRTAREWTPIVAQTAQNNYTICVGQQITLTGGGGDTYLWQPGASVSDSTLSNPTASPDTTTRYTLFVSDSIGCTDDTTVLVTVLPETEITITGDTAACLGETLILTASGADSYNWSPTGLVDDPTAATVTVTATNSQALQVTGQANGCPPDTVEQPITIHPLPVVQTLPDTTIEPGTSVVLVSQTTAPGPLTWQWSPPDFLDDPTISSPGSTPDEPITYQVQVTDGNGCVGSAAVTINFQAPDITDSIPVPNAFTPNGDGRNDTWSIPFAANYAVETIRLYNRWGELVAEGDGSFVWDGLQGGNPMPQGAYLYLIESVDNIGFRRLQTGYVHLIR